MSGIGRGEVERGGSEVRLTVRTTLTMTTPRRRYRIGRSRRIDGRMICGMERIRRWIQQ